MTHIAIPAKQLKNVVAALSELARAKHSHEDFNNIVIGVPANRKHAIYLRATNGDHEAVLYVTATVYQSDETELAVRYKPLHAFLKKAPDDLTRVDLGGRRIIKKKNSVPSATPNAA